MAPEVGDVARPVGGTGRLRAGLRAARVNTPRTVGAGSFGIDVTCPQVPRLLVSSPARGATMVRPGYAWAQDITAGNHVQVVGPLRSLDVTSFISAPIFDLYTCKLHWGAQGGVTSVQSVLLQLSRGGRPAMKTWLFVRAWQTGVRLFCRGFRCSRSERLRCGRLRPTPRIPGHQRPYGFSRFVAP
jgi:hypothetical protein